MNRSSSQVPIERRSGACLFLAGMAVLTVNGWVAGIAAGTGVAAGSFDAESALLLAFTACGFHLGAQLVLGRRQGARAHAHYFAASAGPFVLALVTRDRLPFQLACVMFGAYLIVNLVVARRRAALALALVGGPAVLLNLAAITVIGFVALSEGGQAIPAWLAVAAVARSCAGSAWGGRVMLRAVGDTGWHRTFAAWLVWDVLIAVCRPSVAGLLLTLAAVVLHLVVTRVHQLDAAAC